MTTDVLYQEYEGESIPSFDGDSADAGQCEQWYLMVRTKRDGLSVISGNAIDRWYDQETEYYDYITYAPGVYPLKDDYVVWGSGVGSSAGHIDVCAVNGTSAGFTGYDSNWNDIPTLRTIQHNYEFGILGYVRRKEIDVPSTVGQTELDDLFPAFFGYPPAQADYDAWVGGETNTVIRAFVAAPQHQAYLTYIQDLKNGNTALAGVVPYNGTQLYIKE